MTISIICLSIAFGDLCGKISLFEKFGDLILRVMGE